VNEAVKALRELGADECYLEVRTTNDAGQRLYEKLGFSAARRVPHYYADGAEALVMVLPLKSEESASSQRIG